MFVRRLLSQSFKHARGTSLQLNNSATRHYRIPLTKQIPRGSWDSHMHIIDPSRYSVSRDAQYRPQTHTLAEAKVFEASVGIDNIVLVQPSIYGFDNSCLLEALKQIGTHHARGVVVFDPHTTPQDTLLEWHNLGVRGVRVNLQSVGKSMSPKELRKTLSQYATAVKHLGWVIQIYVPMHVIEQLEHIVPTLGTRVCIDHIGCPDLNGQALRTPYEIPGFRSLVKLLELGDTFVKLSAPYRMSQTTDYGDLEQVARELIRLKGFSRVVFATDWPHTRFEGLDIQPWVHEVIDWCKDDTHLVERLFKGNAEELWDVPAV
ncbi:putative TIM barrel metal-dependent hydrolase [Truncatella angustata]|uniref:TIM barrel metal-dependent hydrolase n=1 Tax=Truncatella angustata TaxID=152316 RepID=A0A9P8RL02_9PEZI|nr:putative TIM barrel metal-dependent hydrolase [Truncatella angustata]KAH6645086.1 putative TIM barrel metal-dependent hydrolase [Truncatella angustata]